MSATNRSDVRLPDDAYMTPPWCVRRLLEAVGGELPGGRWIEPAAGNGSIIAHTMRGDVEWTAVEKRAECTQALAPLVTHLFCPEDFLGPTGLHDFNVAITNPPYSLAFEFYKQCRAIAAHTFLLLRINFIASQARSLAFREDTPDIFVLPNRPSFTGGGTDATEYAWFYFPPERRKVGRIQVLASTTPEERKYAGTVRELGPTP